MDSGRERRIPEEGGSPGWRPRLLFGIDSLTGGGAERVLAHLANAFVRSGCDVTVALTLSHERAYPLDERVRIVPPWFMAAGAPAGTETGPPPAGAPQKPSPYRVLKGFLHASRHLARSVENERPDVILSSLPNTNLIVLLSKLLFGVRAPVVCADHNTLSRELASLPAPGLVRFLVRRLYPLAELHLAVSRGAGMDLHEAFGIDPARIRTIYNGVDVPEIRRAASEPLPPEISCLVTGPGVLTLVSAGRLTQQKGHQDLLKALAEIVSHRPCRLLLLGDGPLRGELEQMTAALGLTNSVHFLGWRPNPHSIVAAADLFVLSSRWEGLPTVLIEALAAGTPVVSTNCPHGPAEILEEGRAGVLVPVSDPEALAREILSLAGDPARREQLRAAGAGRVMRFSLERMVEEYRGLLSELRPGS